MERITVDDLDILMLRNDPAEETGQRAWAKTAGIIFGNVALRSGVIVLNDPTALAGALDKMYMQLLPPNIRPQTLISCDRGDQVIYPEPGWHGGTERVSGLQFAGSVHGDKEQSCQSQPDDRCDRPLRLCHCPGISARVGTRQCPACSW